MLNQSYKILFDMNGKKILKIKNWNFNKYKNKNKLCEKNEKEKEKGTLKVLTKTKETVF